MTVLRSILLYYSISSFLKRLCDFNHEQYRDFLYCTVMLFFRLQLFGQLSILAVFKCANKCFDLTVTISCVLL